MLSKTKINSQEQPHIKMVLWSVFAGSKGCVNRVKIVLKIKQSPLNKNQISHDLKLDYKVVERHLEILENYGLVRKIGNGYGDAYFLSPVLESNLGLFAEITASSKRCKDSLH